MLLAVSSGLQVSVSLSLSPPFVFVCLWLSGELVFVVVAAGAFFRVCVVFGVCWRCRWRCQCASLSSPRFFGRVGIFVFVSMILAAFIIIVYLLVALAFVLLSLLVFLCISYLLSL